METNTSLHAVPHWERLSPQKSRLQMELKIGIRPPGIETLRNTLLHVLGNDILPKIAQAAPGHANLHDGANVETDFDNVSVDYDVRDDGLRTEKDGTLTSKVTVDLMSDQPLSSADALGIARVSVAARIADVIADSYGQMTSKQPLRKAA
jgi:hypothetical protein